MRESCGHHDWGVTQIYQESAQRYKHSAKRISLKPSKKSIGLFGFAKWYYSSVMMPAWLPHHALNLEESLCLSSHLNHRMVLFDIWHTRDWGVPSQGHGNRLLILQSQWRATRRGELARWPSAYSCWSWHRENAHGDVPYSQHVTASGGAWKHSRGDIHQ